MKTFVFFAIIAVLSHAQTSDSESSDYEFFPDWENCNNTDKIQFIDFYLDHQPHAQANGSAALTNTTDNFTICAGQGRNLTIGEFHVQLMKQDSIMLLEKDVSTLAGQRFEEGVYQHCFQVEMPEYLQAGNYSLVAQVVNGKNVEIGCIKAQWEVSQLRNASIVN